jgi:hypothetical protein
MKLAYCYICLTIAAACLAYAGPTGPVYVPPGGDTFSSSGNIGSAGGETFTFSNFNPSQFGSLWWGPTNAVSDIGSDPFAGIQNVSAPNYMNFVGYNGTAYEWDSTSNWMFQSDPSGTVINNNLPTRFLLNFIGPNATPTTKAAAGIASGNTAEAVAQITGNFSANFIFEAETSNNVWQPVLDYFNNSHCISNCTVNTSADFGFWSTAPATGTPEPRFYGLLLIGILALAVLIRRNRLAN